MCIVMFRAANVQQCIIIAKRNVVFSSPRTWCAHHFLHKNVWSLRDDVPHLMTLAVSKTTFRRTV